jgi:phytoene dehydrogenase-like protein
MSVDAGADYDVIVIGSGLGGLTSAAYLAVNGKRTLVLEQYDVVGGCSHVFRRKNQFEFDVGLHYVSDCVDDGVTATILRGLGLQHDIEWLPLDPDGVDTLVFPNAGFEVRMPRGWDEYVERIVDQFPREAEGIRKCTGIMRRIAADVDPWGVPLSAGALLKIGLRAPLIARWGLSTLESLYDHCHLGPGPRAVLAAQSGGYCAPPSRAGAVMHSVFLDQYVRAGMFYPRGGGQALPAGLVDVIHRHGGSVRTRARVEEILVHRGAVCGVRLADGDVISAPQVVSNADLKRTYLELLSPEQLKNSTLRRIKRQRMALPIVSVYLGLDVDLTETRPNTNWWVNPTLDIEEQYGDCYAGRRPNHLATFVTAASLKDPTNPHIAPPGHTSLEIMTPAPPHYEFWGVEQGPAAGERYKRNAAYRETKEELAARLIEETTEIIPEIAGHIVWQEASTPITQERYTRSTGGSCYGLELAVDQLGPTRRPGPKTEIDGLFIAGASTIWCHGIVGTMLGGVGTAGAVLGRDLHGDLRDGKVFAEPPARQLPPDHDPLEACRHLSVKPRSHRRRQAAAL